METETCCPICFEEYSRERLILKHGIQNTDYGKDSKCKHWFCVNCIMKMYFKNIYECPLCRTDISEFIEEYADEMSCYCECKFNCNCDICENKNSEMSIEELNDENEELDDENEDEDENITQESDDDLIQDIENIYIDTDNDSNNDSNNDD